MLDLRALFGVAGVDVDHHHVDVLDDHPLIGQIPDLDVEELGPRARCNGGLRPLHQRVHLLLDEPGIQLVLDLRGVGQARQPVGQVVGTPQHFTLRQASGRFRQRAESYAKGAIGALATGIRR